MTQTVLLAGATGALGSRIAHHLLQAPGIDLRLLVRAASIQDPAKAEALDRLTGASLVEGDLADPASLAAATRGVDVVVSAVQGGADVIVDGQVALAQAAVDNGVRRFLPSDFALDLFHAPEGAFMFDLRRLADSAIDSLALEVVHVLNGAFAEVLAGPGPSDVVDLSTGVGRYWGDGTETFDVTSIEDVARFTARAALDESFAGGVFAVSGEETTFEGLIRIFEKAHGVTLRRERRGSVADLEAWIADTRASDPNPYASIAGVYQHAMLLTPVFGETQNERYADLRPESLAEYVRRTA